MYESLISKFYEADTVSIFMHIRPDGDCIGSALALYGFLKNIGKKPYVFLEEGNEIKDSLKFLPYIDVINAPAPKRFDLAVAVDCGSASRMGNGAFKIFLKAKDFVCIDHHEMSTPFTETVVLEPLAASTTQILYKIFKETDKSAIDANVATLIYAGLMADSGSLTYSSTTAESMLVAAETVALGANPYEINKKLFKDTPINTFKLTSRVLSRAEFYFDNKVGVITFFEKDFQETGTVKSDTDGIINNIIDIKEVKLALAVSEAEDNSYRISVRSKDGVNAGAFAENFGGGGHFAASGLRIYAKYNVVLEKLLEVAKKFIDAL